MQQYPVYLLWNRRKTLTGSPDPTRANGTNRPCIVFEFEYTIFPTDQCNSILLEVKQPINLESEEIEPLCKRKKE